MKGVIFTELLEMMEQTFGADMVDDVLDDCQNLSTDGAYTTVGTYGHNELLEIVSVLSQYTGLSVRELVEKYAHYLFFRFADMMPQFFDKPKTAFDFLETVHGTIHVEVKKLYEDAKLPSFETNRPDNKTFVMVYQSFCPFADLAHGLIAGCIDFYKEDITIQWEDQNTDDVYGRVFTLTKNDG